MANAEKIKFPTESGYEGAYDDTFKCMSGFGSYQYPDGSVYYGYFKRGLFHGFGSLQLAAPFSIVIKGDFENGKLMKIETMFFDDGLHVKLKPSTEHKNQLDFSEWTYLSEEDRRFPAEILNGLRAAGPGSVMLTKNNVARPLDVGEYDTEQGIYNTRTGFINQREQPYTPSSYLACTEDINWIMENCRRGCSEQDVQEPKSEICKKIIETNIDNQLLADRKFGATAKKNPDQKYFAKLYDIEMTAAKKAFAGKKKKVGDIRKTFPKKVDSFGSLFAEKTESRSSFVVNKLADPVIERLACEKKFKPSDYSLSMNMSLLNMKQKRFY